MELMRRVKQKCFALKIVLTKKNIMDVTVKTRKHSIQLLTITAETTTDGGIVDDELAETRGLLIGTQF